MCGASCGEAVRRQPVTYPAYPATDVGVRAADGSPMFGDIPEIPADLVQGRQAAADGDQAQGRMEVLQLRLAVAESVGARRHANSQ